MPNAVVVSNESLAIMMALAGLNLSGRVGVLPHCPEPILKASTWAGLEAVACSPDSSTAGLTAVLSYEMEPRPKNNSLLDDARKQGLPTIIFKHAAFSRDARLSSLSANDPTATIAIVGENNAVPSSVCAVILTADSLLAEKYRNIRSSYGARKLTEVKATANGRVSEFQAGMAMVFLQKILSHDPT
nr:hypothetical protein [Nibricoccus aquaticus]